MALLGLDAPPVNSKRLFRKSTRESAFTLLYPSPILAPLLLAPSSLLKNLEIGSVLVFLPWDLGRSGCCERTLTYAASSLGMRIRL